MDNEQNRTNNRMVTRRSGGSIKDHKRSAQRRSLQFESGESVAGVANKSVLDNDSPKNGVKKPEARRTGEDKSKKTGSGRRLTAASDQLFERRSKTSERRSKSSEIRAPKPESKGETAGIPERRKTEESSSKSGRRAAARKRRRRQVMIRRAVVGAAALLLVVGLVFAVKGIVGLFGGKGGKEKAEATPEQLIARAEVQAAQYDYDAAIETINSYSGDVDADEDLSNALEKYQLAKMDLRPYPMDQITHIFFHSLIYDTSKAFVEGESQSVGYNQYMTTVEEFNKILQSLYDRGYVLVNLTDIAAPVKGDDGKVTMQPKDILLPEGKKPIVISQDDVSYYHSYEGDGIANRLVIDNSGKVRTEYIKDDGSVEIGAHDMVPILDDFVEAHPDFSYKGAKGCIALTGYNGILGYRTDPTYNTEKDRDSHQQAWLDAHPDFDYEEECETAKEVAAVMKDNGWEFASHSWGHMWQTNIDDNKFQIDTQKWMDYVYPLVGGTNIWIYSNGEDVDCETYQARYQILRDNGFCYFCPVSAEQYHTEIKNGETFYQTRRNVDGYRMYKDLSDPDSDRLGDLIDVEEVFDSSRPTPVPEI